jgi:nucleoside 2-deoxyribosyltransferase
MEQQPVIYLASPYSHDDPEIMEQRYQQACAAAAKLINCGVVVYSPIAHSHPIAKIGGAKGDWATWQNHCLSLLDRCDFMLILMLDGWMESTGVEAEARHCLDTQKDIFYSDMDGLDRFNWTCLHTETAFLAA